MTISKLLPLLVLTACAVFPLPGVTAEPTIDGDRVYVLTNAGFLYAFRVEPQPS